MTVGRTVRHDGAAMASDRSARRLIIHGHVQGVFFRDSTRRCAERHGVAGWVRNRADGTVEAWLEGPPEAVHAVEEFCRRGPEGARVEHVDDEAVMAEGLTGFQVR